METTLQRAMENKKMVEMIYMAKNGRLSQRIVRILQIKEEQIVAYCYSRRQVRTFRLENILAIHPVKKFQRKGA
ncbi:WYL domain-containing protein [Virgibacillus senegalensis]|uniref:WYL domain-containing protein n=1 Tax=Virgibacillus senegalensis TaxID=1499679 RepID=UPI00069E7D73|nr:WYL domain-containing protein [Virgibacillus senegalensis]